MHMYIDIITMHIELVYFGEGSTLFCWIDLIRLTDALAALCFCSLIYTRKCSHSMTPTIWPMCLLGWQQGSLHTSRGPGSTIRLPLHCSRRNSEPGRWIYLSSNSIYQSVNQSTKQALLWSKRPGVITSMSTVLWSYHNTQDPRPFGYMDGRPHPLL